MRKKEMLKLLEERAERIVALEQRLEKSNTAIETYRAREQTIIDSLTTAQAESKQRIADAEAKADAMIGKARVTAENAVRAAETSANEIVTKAETYRDELLRTARSQADELLLKARAKSSEILAQTQAAAATYKETLERYNALIAESAAEAQRRAEEYATLLQGKKLDTPDITKTTVNLAGVPYAPAVDLPDAEDNPAQLMRNIYTLERRDIPEEAAAQPAYQTPAAEQSAIVPDGDEAVTPTPAPVPEELPDLAPHPVWEPQDAPEQEAVFAEQETVSEEEPEELPDLAPHPEPAEWRPEDEASEPEWQPDDAEPEAPTVSELTGEPTEGDEIELSLDALLDEIIRSGE